MSKNWNVLATYPNGRGKPHKISANVVNLSTQGTTNGKMRDTLNIVKTKRVKLTVMNKSLFLQICNKEGIELTKELKSHINFK